MKIITPKDQPSAKAPEAYFTGSVRQDNMFSAAAPARVASGFVTFEPGARTAWHTHPFGQLLHIVMGEGWVQKQGEARQTVRAGDTVWFEPGEKHWHGATDIKAMCHVAVTEMQDGTAADWMEKVSDADYLGVIQPAHEATS